MTPSHSAQEHTHFGAEQIPKDQKQDRVNQVFTKVSPYYDQMNDLMSLGMHRIWKRFAVRAGHIQKNQTILDLASGSGDIAALIAARLGSSGCLIQADINAPMLKKAQQRNFDRGLTQARMMLCDGHFPPFKEQSLDRIFIAFGIRNFTDPKAALKRLIRLLKPDGIILILEFARPHAFLQKPYRWYSQTLIPRIGDCFYENADSYRYLIESIEKHPKQEQWSATMQQCGCTRVDINNLAGGVVALYRGYRDPL